MAASFGRGWSSSELWNCNVLERPTIDATLSATARGTSGASDATYAVVPSASR